jgi:hypothetical protein
MGDGTVLKIEPTRIQTRKDWQVAVLSITPKFTDPGAVKRNQVFVDRRNVSLPNLGFRDVG